MSTETKGRKCAGKRRYRTRERALAAVAELVARGAAQDWLTAYACSHCGYHHVGHRPGRRKP
ncbi:MULTISPECIES: hypothetical protein [unclassified Nonomuraea]|uniref:hypothetical protein n=1 Tax=unclassified Nonomuraea TaxID=2593643 RepID=UPI0033E7F59D